MGEEDKQINKGNSTVKPNQCNVLVEGGTTIEGGPLLPPEQDLEVEMPEIQPSNEKELAREEHSRQTEQQRQTFLRQESALWERNLSLVPEA